MIKWLPTKTTLWILTILLGLFFIGNTISFFTGYALGMPLSVLGLSVAVILLIDMIESTFYQRQLPITITRKIPHYFR